MNSRLLVLVLICVFITTPAFADGRMEEARKQFFSVCQQSYVETIKNLDASNQIAAKSSAKALHENLTKLENPLLYVEKDVEGIDPALKARWSTLMRLFGNVRTSTGLLEQKIGAGSYSSELSSLKSYFEKFGDEFNSVYADFVKYGKELNEKQRKMQTICDTCR